MVDRERREGRDRDALHRVCARLRSATDARLERPDDRLAGDSVATTVHRAAAWAASAQGIDQEVPRLHPLASADQLTVIGRDFLDWVAESGHRQAELVQWRDLVERLRAIV